MVAIYYSMKLSRHFYLVIAVLFGELSFSTLLTLLVDRIVLRMPHRLFNYVTD